MTARHVSRRFYDGPAGRVEALLQEPAASPRFAAVASHPHPLHGGTLHEKVTYRVARGLEDAGGRVLRFNFRGAGLSAGVHDEGRGEQDDLRAALAYVRGQGGEGLPTLLAGFSFGAVVSALVAAADPSVDGLLLVGAPVRLHSLDALARWRRPVAFVHGDRDEHGPLDQLRSHAARLEGPTEVRVIRGAGHFFEGQQDELQAVVRELVLDGVLSRAVGPGAGATPAARAQRRTAGTGSP
jgi:hypothetical protein